METLPDEIILIIFENILKITDKRQFLRTCAKYNTLTKYNFIQYEQNYSIRSFHKINNYCMEKFTLELCHDLYFDMIPTFYIIPSNEILGKALGIFNNLELLKIAKNNGCNLESICYNASKYGHLETLKWAMDNGYIWDSRICTYAALNGHFEVVKWIQTHILTPNKANNHIY